MVFVGKTEGLCGVPRPGTIAIAAERQHSLALDGSNSASIFLHGLCRDPMGWQPLYPGKGGMGHCHNLLSLCHWHCAARALTTPPGPPPHSYFYRPPTEFLTVLF